MIKNLNKYHFLLASLLILIATAPISAQINLYTHRHYDSDKILFEKFTKETGIKINVIKGSADQLIQRMISEGKNSPADILLTVDAGRLHRAKEAGVLQSINSKTINKNVPSEMRDPDGFWYGLTVRARVIVYAKDRINSNELSTYEDLANAKWKGKIAIRSSGNIYNQSLMASLIEANGSRRALRWAMGIRKNMARAPRGNDRDQVRAVAAGLADIAVVNTYYLGILANSKEKKDRDVFNKVSVFFPNQNNRGTHINISGAGIAKYSKNKSDAIKFIEFLTSPEAQETFGKVNYEYPLFIENNKSDLLKSWGAFKADKQNLSILGIRNSEAVKLFDRADWK
jgi:iron(III) transport system substrate-binding protein